MIIKIYYRRNLKMSTGKLASQVGHVSAGIQRIYPNTRPSTIKVLSASDKKFDEILDKKAIFMQVDDGITEVPRGSITAA